MKENNTSIIPINNNAIEKATGSIRITNKLLKQSVERIFNEVFYLMNSKNSEIKKDNFFKNIEDDSTYLSKFCFKTKSNEDILKAEELLKKIYDDSATDYRWILIKGILKYQLASYNNNDKIKELSDSIRLISEATKINSNIAFAFYFLFNVIDDFVEIHISRFSSDDTIYKAMVKNINAAVDIEPFNFEYRKKRAEFRGGNWGKGWGWDLIGSIEDYTFLIENGYKEEEMYFNRARVKENDGIEDYDGAITDYSMVIKMNPKDKWAFERRAGLLVFKRKYSEAIEDYSKAIELDSNYVVAYQNRGYAKKRIGDFEGAKKDFDKAIVLKRSKSK